MRGGHKRERHRSKHLAFDSMQAEDRNKHDDDDDPCEENRFTHSFADSRNTLQAPVCLDGHVDAAGASHTVFNHHHRTVDDHTEVDRSEAHQVGRNAA